MASLPISRVHIQLQVEGETMLSILLTDSGQVNRFGDGTGEPEASGWHLGSTDEPLFEEFMTLIDADLLELAGRYRLPNPQGEICELTISLEGEEVETGFAFRYGTDSDGPPEEILELVNAAVDLTEAWWQAQRFKRKK